MKLFKQFFRPNECWREILREEEINASGGDSEKAKYYIKLLKESNKQPITQASHFEEAIKKLPDSKVAVFFNLGLFCCLQERHFDKLDKYILQAKEGQVAEALYIGVSHGPCCILAFSKSDAPQGFDGKCFCGGAALVAYI